MRENETSRPAKTAPAPPPRWAVITVKCCVIGILALPLATPAVLAASTALGPGLDPFRHLGFLAAVALWLALFGTAQLLTTTYPPVPRRRP
ncbi:MAG TPA: hypothetical protein VFG59_13565 [Anaeromyxobacter sp.]|nr:hypothetical protein [Anaeromyxobacter sp.]